jgi:hypothetical protein
MIFVALQDAEAIPPPIESANVAMLHLWSIEMSAPEETPRFAD